MYDIFILLIKHIVVNELSSLPATSQKYETLHSHVSTVTIVILITTVPSHPD